MAVKLLVAGLAGSGKTTLLSSLKDTLVISHDGKAFGLALPHANVKTFNTAEDLIQVTMEKVQAYKEKFGAYPKTIVYDSVSKIFDTLSLSCNKRFSGFTIYSELNKEINKLNEFLENDVVAAGANLVILSHAVYDQDADAYKLVAQGKFAERGGYYAEVDESIFIVAKNNKRTVHLRSPKYLARTLQKDLEDSVDSADFNLQDHINRLTAIQAEAVNYSL